MMSQRKFLTAITLENGLVQGAQFSPVLATDLPESGVTPGTYANATVTVDAAGRVTAAANGSAGSGTVTSVALTLPGEFSVSNSPVTTSGTLAVTKATQAANTVWAGPTTGAAAQPAFRSLVAADLPASGVSAGTYGDGTHVAQITVDAAGRITSASSVAISGGGGVSIGDPVGGSLAGTVLYVDLSNNLANSSKFAFNTTSGLTVNMNSAGAQSARFEDGAGALAIFSNGGVALNLSDGVNSLSLCDGTNHVGYSAAVALNWAGGTPPTDVWVALDRIAAALAGLGAAP